MFFLDPFGSTTHIKFDSAGVYVSGFYDGEWTEQYILKTIFSSDSVSGSYKSTTLYDGGYTSTVITTRVFSGKKK